MTDNKEADRKILIRKIQLRREIEKRKCQDSFYHFTKIAFRILHNEEKLIDNWHIEFLCNNLQERAERRFKKLPRESHLLINIPPRSLKSEIVAVFYNAWCWIHKPSLSFVSASYSDSLSTDHNVMTRQIISSDWYQRNWGDKVTLISGDNQKRQFQNKDSGRRFCTSTRGTVTGKGGNIIVIDDPQNPLQAESETERKTVVDFYKKTLSSRLNNPETDFFILVMQRLHDEDLTGYLLENHADKWEHICIPAEDGPNVKPVHLKEKYDNGLMFSKRFSRDFLDEMKEDLGSRGYEGQYKQNPSPEDGDLFKKAWFNVESILKVPFERLRYEIYIDGAYTKNTANDPSGIDMFGHDDTNKKCYWFQSVDKYFELPELLKYIPDFCENNDFDSGSKIMIEPKASGESIRPMLIQKGFNAVRINSKFTKLSKYERASSASPFVEAGRLIVVKAAWNEDSIKQLTSFPNAKHDEHVDNLSYMILENYIKKKKRGIRSGN